MCTDFDTKKRLVDHTWTGFEFSRQEKSHVMGRVPDVSQPLGLIFLLELKKGRAPDVFRHLGLMELVGVKKVGHVGRLPHVNRLSWRYKFYLTFELINGLI
jgi:hypothetical protein